MNVQICPCHCLLHPLADIVEEMHRLRSLQQQHAARQRSRFSAAFAAGLLHQPADDEPPAAAAQPVDPSDPAAAAAAAAAAGLRHVVVPQGRRVAGPVPAEHVLDGGRPVLVDDAWGRHLLVADDGEGEGSGYSRGLMARLARMGLAGSGIGYGSAAAGTAGDGWGEAGEGHSDSGDDEAAGSRDSYDDNSLQQHNGNGHHAAAASALAPQGAAAEGSHSSTLQQDADRNGHSMPAAAGSSSGLAPQQGEPEEPGLPEVAEAAQAAAAGVAVAARSDNEQRSYGDGALGAVMRKVPL
jgi:hypothetical protein